jgi:hypothetical protein
LRVPKSGILPDFGIGVCLRQTPSIRRWRIASNCRFAAITSGNSGIHAAYPRGKFFNREVEKVKEVEERKERSIASYSAW